MQLSCIAQNTYSSSYKVTSTTAYDKSNAQDSFQNLFLTSMVYVFNSNDKICYLDTTSTMTEQGLYSKVSGDENLFINYLTNTVVYKLNQDNCFRFKTLEMKKHLSNLKILGLKTEKYISADGKIIIYTCSKLPWYVQPGLFSCKSLNGCVVKFENMETHIGFELVEYKILKDDAHFKFMEDTILSLKKCNKENVFSPFIKSD